MSYSIAAGPGAGAGRATGPEASWENGPGGRLRVTPGRVAALALGVPIALAMIGWTAFNVVALLGQASFPVDYSFPVQGGQVNVQIDGNVTVQQAQLSGGRAELRGTAHYSLFRSSVTEKGDTVTYNCHSVFGNCSLDGTLQVPERTAVSLSTSGGDLSVGNFTGNVKLNTDGGNVNVSSLTGGLQVSTAGGDVNVGTVNDTGLLRLTTDGGNITGQAVNAPSAIAHTAGGDISLTYTTVPTNLQITTDGGNVTLDLPHDSTAYQVSATTDGGNVHIDSSVHQDSSAHGHTIYVHTAGGDINITEAS